MSRHGGAHPTGPALAWLAHPVTVGALVVLIANDHWWKHAVPGPVTGKLSDVAGLLLLPPLLAVLARLPAVAAIVVDRRRVRGVKAFAFGADAASALWTVLSGPSVIRQDVTDLIALPALGIAWWTWTRARERPLPRGFVARLVLVPFALLGVVATSAPEYPRVDVVADWDGTLVLARETYYYEGGTPTWLTSDDAGRTWTDLDARRRRSARAQPRTASTRTRSSATASCPAGSRSRRAPTAGRPGACRGRSTTRPGGSWRPTRTRT